MATVIDEVEEEIDAAIVSVIGDLEDRLSSIVEDYGSMSNEEFLEVVKRRVNKMSIDKQIVENVGDW